MLWSLLELFYGTTLLLVLVIGATVLTNKITARVSASKSLWVLLLHMFILVFLLYFIRVLLNVLLFNTNLVNTIFMLTGPIIGATSLYVGPIIKEYTTKIV